MGKDYVEWACKWNWKKKTLLMGTQTLGRFLRLSVGKVWGGCPGCQQMPDTTEGWWFLRSSER